jgi:glycosyltransferase involved in cell wall biosynthesis
MSFNWDSSARLSVLMPAYNEGGEIVENLLRVRDVVRETGNFEIVVVDDGSTDNTASELERARSLIPELKAVILKKNVGKGHALKTGFESTTGDLVFFLDADLDLPPEQMEVLWATMCRENSEVVIGSKRHPQSANDYPIQRRIMSAAYFFLVKIMFGLPIHDTQTGIKLFRREVLAKCFPKMLVKSFAYDLELLMLAHHYGYVIAEAPVVVKFHYKLGGIGVQSAWDIWWDTMALFYRLRILKYYDKLDEQERTKPS